MNNVTVRVVFNDVFKMHQRRHGRAAIVEPDVGNALEGGAAESAECEVNQCIASGRGACTADGHGKSVDEVASVHLPKAKYRDLGIGRSPEESQHYNDSCKS